MDIERLSDITVERFRSNPLITPDSDDEIGTNINGPSPIRVPDWIADPLGQYYLYFANHHGTFIRLAYADHVTGPWEIYGGGALELDETPFDDHIASPDVHVHHDLQRIVMYFHGCCGPFRHASGELSQATDVATSADGLNFSVVGDTLGFNYFRVWEFDRAWYAVANDGHLYRGTDPYEPFEKCQQLFPKNRHFAVRLMSDATLQVFLSRRGDRPERLMVAQIDLEPPYDRWRADPHPPETVLWPEQEYEGGRLPLETSSRGFADEPVRQLRDPAILVDDDHTYLFYSLAGERGIAGGTIIDGR